MQDLEGLSGLLQLVAIDSGQGLDFTKPQVPQVLTGGGGRLVDQVRGKRRFFRNGRRGLIGRGECRGKVF